MCFTLRVQTRVWVERADCRRSEYDPDWWYPHRDAGSEPSELTVRMELRAKLVCASCPVRQECLDEALGRGERHGIWGGLTPRERFKLAGGKGSVIEPQGEQMSPASRSALWLFVERGVRLTEVAAMVTESSVSDLLEMMRKHVYSVEGEARGCRKRASRRVLA